MEKNELQRALEAALASKNQEQLQSLARTAVENYEEEAFGYVYLAESFLLGNSPIYANAENCLAKAAECEPNEIKHLLRLAELKDLQGDFADAYLLYSKALDIDDTNLSALMACGLFQSRQMEDCDAAMQFFDKVIELDANNLLAHFGRAEALASAERYEAALADLGFVLEREFQDSAALLKIDILENQGKFEDTVELRKALVAARPDFAGYAYTCGRTLSLLGRYAEAAPYFAKAYDLLVAAEQPLDVNLLDDYSFVTLHLEQFQKTVDLTTKLIETPNHEDVSIFIRRAEAKVGLGDFDGAAKDLALAEKNETWADEVQLQRAILAVAKGEFAKAEAIYKPLTEKPGSNRAAALGLAKLYAKQNNLAESYKWAKFAARKEYLPAVSYINQQLSDYLAKTRQQLLAQNAPAAAQNAASPAAQKLFGGVWVFDSIKSKRLEGMPADGMERLRAIFADFCIVFSASGIFVFNPADANAFVYKIDKQSPESLQMQMLPIDGMPAQTVQIKVAGDSLIYSKEEGEFFKLKKISAANLSAQTRALITQKVPKSQIDFLGKEAEAMIYG